MDYSIIVYIIFGVLPSLTWLSFYLREDIHPEPKKMILKIFLWGAAITIPVFFVQLGLQYLLSNISMNSLLRNIIYWLLVIALSEEFFKYLVIKIKVINSPELDEPIDIMLYMIVAALGFAAIENILYLVAPMGQMSFSQLIDRTLFVDLVRFIGATFLHTLCSAAIGYSLAISFCEVKRKYLSLGMGLLMATLLHGLYDFSIMTVSASSYINIVIPVVIILVLAAFVFTGFNRLKKMKSVCKIR